MRPEKKSFDAREMPRVRAGGSPAAVPGRLYTAGGRKVAILPLGRGPRPIVWVHMPAEAAAETARLLAGENLVLAAVTDTDWERELSPWSAGRAFKGGRDFAGGGEEYLAALKSEIIPAAEKELSEVPLWRGIAGYSLAGLFALWATWGSDSFSRFASVSGSLWYDGFTAYLQETEPVALPEKAYFSLGALEKNTKNTRLAQVERCTAEAAARLAALGCETIFEKNEGGHFSGAEMRVAKGIRWLLR